jgi:autotransporter strand-loop-strand O-heptosyltransferase
MKKILLDLSDCYGIGDILSSTPTIRKLYQSYGHKITVSTHIPELFDSNPYIEKVYNSKVINLDYVRDQYILHSTFDILGKKTERGVEYKHSMIDIRQYHAISLGFMLSENEMECDYYPKDYEPIEGLPEKYVLIHPVQTWPNRTWSASNWMKLTKKLNDNGISVVSIGKDSSEVGFFNINKPTFNFEIKNGLNLINKTSLSQAWHLISKSMCFITMDSGLLHLAGTTDAEIIMLGSSIKPEYRSPYRNSTQDYKYSYGVGGCGLHCASDLKYSLRDWGHIQSVTLISTCLEKKPSFDCNPSFLPVVELTKKIWIGDDNVAIDKQKSESFENIKPRTLVEIQSNALGDTIGAMSIIEKWRKETNKDITVISNFSDLFQTSYPSLKIINKKSNTQYLPVEGIWIVDDTPHSEKISTTYKFEVPLLEGYAQDFGITADDIELKVDLFKKERPIQSKYVCIAVQSTTQAKYWNNPGAWDELCRMLRKKGLTPVCIDKDFSFGIPGHFNEAPSKAVKKNGLSLEDTINYLYHCEMFIGLSSGLSWLAQGLQKPTVMISNVTSKDHEYIDERTLRIYEESVCHGCFHKYPFNSGDWLWCPVYRDDEQKRFICTKAITPESVMEQIEKFYNI